MLKIRKPIMATDEVGGEVLLGVGDTISEISDDGPRWRNINGSPEFGGRWTDFGWNVTVRFTPSHKQWTELVTVDAVKLLKALEG